MTRLMDAPSADMLVADAQFAADGPPAKTMGFSQVASGPFVRSSYHARDMAESNSA